MPVWIAGATVVVITTTVMSCGDTPTMPLGSPLHLPRFDVAPLSDSVLGPYTLSGASNYQTSLVLPPKFAYSTLVQVEAAGIVTQTSSTGGQVAIGPEGWGVGSNCYKASAVHFGSVRTNWSCQIDAAPETPDPVTLAMIVKDSGTAYIGNGNFYLCPDCWYSYSGSREFTIRVARPGLKLAANDTFVVPSVSKSIAFTAAVDPNAVWGKTVPRTVLRWRWAPDGGTETTITNCGMTCSRSLNQPGTMYVDVRVNGRELTAGVRIHAEELKLVGVPDTVFPGEGITYTASTKFGSSITNGAWQWRRGATMIGDTLTAAQCQAGSTTCHVETFEFGEMEFTGMVAGVQMSATDSSFVWPCPPTDSINPDSILMDPAVLKRLFEALKHGKCRLDSGFAQEEGAKAGHNPTDRRHPHCTQRH